mgnify:FL=1
MGGCGRGRVITPEEIVKQLDEKCILCMSLGMSYTDYWEGENCLPSFFIQAYNKRRKREMEEQNFSAWLNGLYCMNAFGVALSNAFAKQGSPQAEYPDKPLEIFPREKTAAEIEAERRAILRRIDRSLSAMESASKQIFGKEKI